MAITFKKIDPEFKTRWLKALRSGRYKQIDSRLRAANHYRVTGKDAHGDPIKERVSGVGYCCLGVGLNLLSTKWVPSNDGQNDYPDSFDWGRGPDAILTTATTHLPFLKDDNAASKLAEMNDEGNSFSDIADWIEENL